jgi:hypothetical protein
MTLSWLSLIACIALPGMVHAQDAKRGPTRIDFDDRLIQGQSNKAGAVYLYDRKQLKQGTLIKAPRTFRNQIEVNGGTDAH